MTKITRGKLIDNSGFKIAAGRKPVKATMSYGIKNLGGYEDRSRQNASNVLNQSLSENNAYDSNPQRLGYGFNDLEAEDYNATYDHPMNLITRQLDHEDHQVDESPTNSQYITAVVAAHPYQENEGNEELNERMNERMRRFSNSTEKIMTSTQLMKLLAGGHHQHNISSNSLGNLGNK